MRHNLRMTTELEDSSLYKKEKDLYKLRIALHTKILSYCDLTLFNTITNETNIFCCVRIIIIVSERFPYTQNPLFLPDEYDLQFSEMDLAHHRLEQISVSLFFAILPEIVFSRVNE